MIKPALLILDSTRVVHKQNDSGPILIDDRRG